MKIVSYDFKIGLADGEYSSTDSITDSILKRSEVSHIMVDNTVNKDHFSQDIEKGRLALHPSLSVSPGSTVTVFFKSPLKF